MGVIIIIIIIIIRASRGVMCGGRRWRCGWAANRAHADCAALSPAPA